MLNTSNKQPAFDKPAVSRKPIYLINQRLLPAATAILLIATLIIMSCNSTSTNQSHSLFNGKDLQGWHADVPEMDTNSLAKSPFIVRNGMLVSLASPEGHLITDSVYQDYRLTVEYRFTGKPGNCGVLVHASTPRALYKMFPKSLEVQLEHTNAGDFWCIAEDIEVPDMEKRRGPKNEWGVTNGKKRRILNLTDSSENAPGEWNTMIIECIGNSIKVWVNNELVNHGINCTASKGRIALQAEGCEVEFRKVELKAVNGDLITTPSTPRSSPTFSASNRLTLPGTPSLSRENYF